jgi:hypothetical protein
MAIVEFSTEAPVTDPVVDRPVVAERRHGPDGLNGRLSGWWAAGLAVAWFAIFSTGVALEPAPADPNAALPLVETILVSGLMIGWTVMAAGFARRRRYGAAGSLVAAFFLVGMTFACPVSGHHTGIGAWWWFELAGSTTLVGLSGRALRAA